MLSYYLRNNKLFQFLEYFLVSELSGDVLNLQKLDTFINVTFQRTVKTQPTLTCSKSIMETPGNDWNVIQILCLHETSKELIKYK